MAAPFIIGGVLVGENIFVFTTAHVLGGVGICAGLGYAAKTVQDDVTDWFEDRLFDLEMFFA